MYFDIKKRPNFIPMGGVSDRSNFGPMSGIENRGVAVGEVQGADRN